MAKPVLKKERKERHLNVKPLAVNNFVKVNKLQSIKSPIIFNKAGDGNNPDGLLSNDIFGITQYSRGNTFAYIDLGDKHHFISPLFYNALIKLDRKISDCVHGTKNFIIKNGELVPDPNGETGLKFLYNNYSKLKFKKNGTDRDYYIDFITKFKDKMWISKYIVIPAFYRDVDSAKETHGGIGVGDINKLYVSLINACKTLSETSDYGLSLSSIVSARVQDIIMQTFDWFGENMGRKQGIINRSVTSKSTDLSSRLVISAPELEVENMDDIMVTLDKSAIPLAGACANFYPFILFWLRNLFHSSFVQDNMVDSVTKANTDIIPVRVVDPEVQFSDEVIKKEIDRFIHGYSTRLRPVEIKYERDNKIFKGHLRFKGYQVTTEDFVGDDYTKFPIQERTLTWCDLLYMAAVDVTKDKMVLITRYPIDSCYNQFPTEIVVNSTIDKQPMVVNGKLYKYYPRITEELIGSNTSNLFVDTCNISNLYLDSIGGDYDGDQVSNKPIFSVEANAELKKQLNSKAHYISLSGQNIMHTTNEGVDALYGLTIVLPDDLPKLTKDVK